MRFVFTFAEERVGLECGSSITDEVQNSSRDGIRTMSWATRGALYIVPAQLLVNSRSPPRALSFYTRRMRRLTACPVVGRRNWRTCSIMSRAATSTTESRQHVVRLRENKDGARRSAMLFFYNYLYRFCSIQLKISHQPISKEIIPFIP